MANAMAEVIERHPELKLTGFLSSEQDRGRLLASKFGVKSYQDLGCVLDDPSVKFVYIAQRNSQHADAAVSCLNAGLPVLCEKPSGISYAETQRIVAAASQTGKLFMEAIATPFLPAVEFSIENLRSGRLGTPHFLIASFGYPATSKTHAGCFATDGGGVLLDRMCYLVSMSLIMLGGVADIKSSIIFNDAGIDVDAALLLTHKNGAISQLSASFSSGLANDLVLCGTKANLRIEAPLLSGESVLIKDVAIAQDERPKSLVRIALARSAVARHARELFRRPRKMNLSFGPDIYHHELQHFLALLAVGSNESPILPLNLSLEVARIIEEARKAR